jgi:bifunctional UDP-N-acetylglucosamine pyrophosphorylase/glucosamine-1-phosphate N-acetyltransferase
MTLGVVILAAGQGTRMYSALPKVLHQLGGLPLLEHVLGTAKAVDPERTIVVHGHGGEQVRQAFADAAVDWVQQVPQLGTGDAVRMAMPLLTGLTRVLVLYADVPLLQPDALQPLVESTAPIALLTMRPPSAHGYGRIVRDASNSVTAITEEKDATPEQRRIGEVNTGIMAMDAVRLAGWLGSLSNDNAQGEYYLTDLVAMAVAEGLPVDAFCLSDHRQAEGVNNRLQLAEVERYWQRREAERLMLSGVTLRDPARFDLRGELHAGRDVCIDINVIVRGRVVLGDDVEIGPGCVLEDVEIAAGTRVREHCVLEQAQIGRRCQIGPFARVRPGTNLEQEVHLGNFVEVKNSRVAAGSKINHLSYVGDSDVGSSVNIGAGTITCNYDGANKHRTIIGDDAFIGSNSALVAPVTIGKGATIGAGSVITRDTPDGVLTLSRAPQSSLPGWRRPTKED